MRYAKYSKTPPSLSGSCFDGQISVLTSEQWPHEMGLPERDVRETPARYQHAHHFLEVSLDVFADVTRVIPLWSMDPYTIGLGQLGPGDRQRLSSSKERDLVWAIACTECRLRSLKGSQLGA